MICEKASLRKYLLRTFILREPGCAEMRVARDGRNVSEGFPGRRERTHGPSRTNPEINVIVYHCGNVIPDREDKWQRNMIRCTAVGRPRRWGAFSFLVFTYRSEGRTVREVSVLFPRGERRYDNFGTEWDVYVVKVASSVWSTKDGRWLLFQKSNRIGFCFVRFKTDDRISYYTII